MDDIGIPLIIGILVMMLLSAFFSGMEIAFVSSNRMLAEMEKDKFGIARLPLQVFYKHPNNFVSTMLVGNNIVLVIYGILVAKLFDNTIFSGLEPGITVPADTILSTIIVLFTGEFLPKSIFKSNANRLLTVFAFPAFIFYIVLWPISRFSTMLSHLLMRLAGIKIEKENGDEEFSKLDLDHLVNSSIAKAKDESEIDEDVRIFQNALEFSDTKVRDCMIPRTEICAVEYNSSVDELKNIFIESGKSKIIVYNEDIDHIIGYIHSSEMFRDAKNWHKGIQNMPYVPETMPAQKLMQTFMQQKKTLGVVIDEFGGTSGIVSLEDIVEEIFGDIEDEHDNSNYVAKQISEDEYVLSARLEIDKVNDMFALSLPESEDYMTIGGLILNYYQSFPKLNEIVTVGDFEFKIIKNTMTKIELVRMKVLK
ncbi:hemolysin family protein [Prevotella koreensis]|uniref:HlyC/CorC family transporter n=1 Tax=Prevotella koreensis TaxID=2490854 RepID=A0A3S0PBS6_9BACT|nr:hemolysin family protein [Prevotella koreensis]RUL59026.1 HlyC/CorC family transporter [Prevotella koreensis]